MVQKNKKGTFKVFFKRRANQLYWIGAVGIGTFLLLFSAWAVYSTALAINNAFRPIISAPADMGARFQLGVAQEIRGLQGLIALPIPTPLATPQDLPLPTASPVTSTPAVSPLISP